jgi:hypothetical protein
LVLQVEKRIRTRVKRQIDKTQREFFLYEQMKAIQKELGDAEGKDELAEIEDKIKKTKLSKEAREKATHELRAVAGRGGGSGGDRALRVHDLPSPEGTTALMAAGHRFLMQCFESCRLNRPISL